MKKAISEDNVLFDEVYIEPLSTLSSSLTNTLHRKMRSIVEKPYKPDDNYKKDVPLIDMIKEAVNKG